ncbi:hypothetical protein [Actinoalloteichus sp. GBA129-24]|uniref:hypothetical protein n=1 Tax=Actinoalloteichus sp. GBA129-24 TaxID=1612551 RepID=UPI0012FA277C|nr:hypothetical protein [Actinoalloteichus sp. GBA129-24]
MAAYATDGLDDDSTASTLASLGVAPLLALPGPDAAETMLLVHARRMQAEGCVLFTVCSGDHAFAALTDSEVARVEVLVWEGQPVSTKLAEAAGNVRTLPRPGAVTSASRAPAHLTAPADPDPDPDPMPRQHIRHISAKLPDVVTGFFIGVGIAVGHRLTSLLFPSRPRHRHPTR